MKLQHQILAILTANSLLTCRASLPSVPRDEHGDYNGSDLIDWINSHPQGYVHPSVRIGRAIPGDPNSMYGLYVSSAPGTKAIEGDEIIARIPWSHLIGPGDEYDKAKFFSCQEIRNLAAELKKGEESQYGPYVRYLLSQKRGTIPGEWSEAGKRFLMDVLDHGDLPPYEMMWFDDYDKTWLQRCRGRKDDDMEKFAYYLASSRDEDTLMIPIYDMANHSNDAKKLNTLSFKPDKPGKAFRFEASRTIMPGEEIFNSYNRCNPCSIANFDHCETFSYQPTPDMFASFGFVEQLPQYWKFDSTDEDEDDDEIAMCLSMDDDGELKVMWKQNAMPDEIDFEFLKKHVKRLKGLKDKKEELEKTLVLKDGEESRKKMPMMEWNLIWWYYEELVRAMNAAIKYAPPDDEIGDEL